MKMFFKHIAKVYGDKSLYLSGKTTQRECCVVGFTSFRKGYEIEMTDTKGHKRYVYLIGKRKYKIHRSGILQKYRLWEFKPVINVTIDKMIDETAF